MKNDAAPRPARRTMLLRLQLRTGLPAWGLVLLVVATVAALLAGAIGYGAWAQHVSARRVYRTAVLAGVNLAGIGYALAFVLHALHSCRDDLLALQDRVNLAPEVLRERAEALGASIGWRWRSAVFLLGTCVCVYMTLTSDNNPFTSGRNPFAGIHAWELPFFILFWCTMLYATLLALRIANRLAAIARHHAIVDLLSTDALAPFMMIGVRLSMIALGGLALIPLQTVLIDTLRPFDWLPAALLVSCMGMYLLLRPMLGVREAIRVAKARELERLAAALGYRAERPLDEVAGERFDHLLHYREFVRNVSEWPLSRWGVVRMLLYVVIPPFAWSGAALIQHFVDEVVN